MHNRDLPRSLSGPADLPVCGQDYRLKNTSHTFHAANVQWCEHSGRTYPVFSTPGVRTWRYRLALGIQNGVMMSVDPNYFAKALLQIR